jgi:polyhydroxyalkanoate synthesis regulator phasin
MFKDMLYLGLGSALLVKEKVENELNELKKKGKISEEEVKKVLQSANERGKEEEQKIKELLKDALKEVIDELELATKEDIKNLEKKLEK